MTVKCKECGISYDSKYNICPSCGAVRFVLPLYTKIIAVVAAAYLALTAIMFPLGVFTFAPDGGDGDDGGAAAAHTAAAEPPDESTASPAAPSPTPEEPSASPNSVTPTTSPKQEAVKITIRSQFSTYDEEGFTWYIGDGTIKLTAVLEPEPAGQAKIIWKSSDTSIFTVDDGLVTPLAPGTATLTASFDKTEARIRIIIREGSLGGEPTTSPVPTTRPPAYSAQPQPSPPAGVTPSPEPTQPPEATAPTPTTPTPTTPPPTTPPPTTTPTAPPATTPPADPTPSGLLPLIRGD